MVGAFSDVVPGSHQRLELREGRVDLPCHGGLLGFFLDHLGRQLPEIAQDRRRKLYNLDLALELSLESFKSDRVLQVEVAETVDVHGRRGMVQHPPKIDWERLV